MAKIEGVRVQQNISPRANVHGENLITTQTLKSQPVFPRLVRKALAILAGTICGVQYITLIWTANNPLSKSETVVVQIRNCDTPTVQIRD